MDIPLEQTSTGQGACLPEQDEETKTAPPAPGQRTDFSATGANRHFHGLRYDVGRNGGQEASVDGVAGVSRPECRLTILRANHCMILRKYFEISRPIPKPAGDQMKDTPLPKSDTDKSDPDISLADWMKITPVMCHSIDDRGILVSVSDSWLNRLGYDKEEVIGQLSSKFLTEESRQRARTEIIPAFFRDGRTDNAGYQMVCKNGDIIDILLSAVLVREPSRDISIAVITDISQMKAIERKLAHSETRYRHVVENQSEMVSLARTDGELLFVNSAYAANYGTTPEALIGRNLLDLVPPDAREGLRAHLQRLILIGEATDIENQVTSQSGTTRWISWTNKTLVDEDGVSTVIHSVGKDVDARVDAEMRIKESEARYRLLADNSTDMVFQLDTANIFHYISPACIDILGYDIDQLKGRDLGGLVHPDDRDSLASILAAFGTGQMKRHTAVHQFLHRDGHYVWVEMQIKALHSPIDGTSKGAVGTLRDFTVRKQMEDQLRDANSRLTQMAETDGLTGLLNRRAFDQALSEACQRARHEGHGLGLILADVDWFKPYNDRYGHPAGDECLQRLSVVLGQVATARGCRVARYGGEEFCIIVSDTDESTMFLVAETLRIAFLNIGIRHEGSPFKVATISLGLATTDASGASDCLELINAADRALYEAKASGRNTVVRASRCGNAVKQAGSAA